MGVIQKVIEEKRKQFDIEEDDEDMQVESVDSDDWDDDIENSIANNNCIFCDHHSKNLVNNLKPNTLSSFPMLNTVAMSQVFYRTLPRKFAATSFACGAIKKDEQFTRFRQLDNI